MSNSRSAYLYTTGGLSSIRRTPGWFIALMLLVYFLLSGFSNLLPSLGDALRPFCRATGYLVHPTLLNYVLFFAVLGLMWWKVGRLGLRDLGLDRSQLPAAILWVLGFWIAAQLGYLAIHRGEVRIDPAWDWGIGATSNLGALLGQLFGNALCEELFWRAFVLTQLAAFLHQRRGWKPRGALSAAVLVSSALFALSHIPHDLAQGHSLATILGLQAARLAGGLLFAGIYALSANLLLVIGVHAVMNVPVSLFEGYATPAGQGFFGIGSLVLMALLALRRRRA